MLTASWGQQQLGSHPAYLSDIADDHAPFEFALALSGGPPEVQFYVEPLGAPPTAAGNLRAARRLLEHVAEEFGACLDPLRIVEDLFLPDAPAPPFSLWIGVSCKPGRNPLFKIYLNPQVRGPAAATQLVTQALTRLGHHQAWTAVQTELGREPGRTELGIVSLDLAQDGAARVKIYVRLAGATIARVTRLAELTREYSESDIRRFYATLADSSGPYLLKPPIVEFAFVEPGASAPSATTLEFPVGKYAPNDELAHQRITRCLQTFGVATAPYERAIQAFAGRPLSARSGLHAHATLRRTTDGPRIGLYFASEAYVAGDLPNEV